MCSSQSRHMLSCCYTCHGRISKPGLVGTIAGAFNCRKVIEMLGVHCSMNNHVRRKVRNRGLLVVHQFRQAGLELFSFNDGRARVACDFVWNFDHCRVLSNPYRRDIGVRPSNSCESTGTSRSKSFARFTKHNCNTANLGYLSAGVGSKASHEKLSYNDKAYVCRDPQHRLSPSTAALSDQEVFFADYPL